MVGGIGRASDEIRLVLIPEAGNTRVHGIILPTLKFSKIITKNKFLLFNSVNNPTSKNQPTEISHVDERAAHAVDPRYHHLLREQQEAISWATSTGRAGDAGTCPLHHIIVPTSHMGI